MAQSSYRTGSLNNIFSAKANIARDAFEGTKNPTARRHASSSNHKIITQSSLAVRPMTPTIYHASEAHIHRIRTATSRADSKRNFQLFTPAIRNAKPPSEAKDVSDSDNDDVESVDWTAPLDITAYLYKPEFIIRPASKTSMEDIGLLQNKQKNNDNLLAAEASSSTSSSALRLPVISEGLVSANSSKEEFVKSYVRRSMGRDRRGPFNREMSNYTTFIKELKDDLREMTEETKRLEVQLPRNRNRTEKARDEIIHRGYLTLKRTYELNPDLTEAAAKKHVCGPPGNDWMGLTRVEVLEVMQRIRKELGVPPAKYNNDDPRMNFLRLRNKKSNKKGTRKSKKKTKKSSATKTRKTKMPKLKTPVVPYQHIPGPKHLHSNVCIRPWEATLDGWSNMTGDEKDANYSGESQASFDFDNPPTPSRRLSYSSPPNSLADEHFDHQTQDSGEENYITLEIFNPVFKINR